MPVDRTTPVGKQRVRTGCLTCRKRRRKCDEGKPDCSNCVEKGLLCKYGSGLTFVASYNGPHRSKEAATQISEVVSAHTAAAESDTSRLSRVTASPSSSGWRQVESYSSAPRLLRAITSPSTVTWQQNLNPQQNSPINEGHSIDGTDVRHHDWFDHGAAHTSVTLITGTSQGLQSTANSNQETDLLRHFRYSLATWLDVGDPDCSFGIRILMISGANRSLLAAILALTAYQRSLIYQLQKPGDRALSLKFRDEAASALEAQDGPIDRTGKSLLMLGDYFSSGPLRWKSLLHHQVAVLGGPNSFATREEELNETLFWLHLRLDLAASVISSSPPLLSFSSPVHIESIPMTPEKKFYQQALLNLASCLSLVYKEREEPKSSPQPQSVASFYSAQPLGLSSQWVSLWTKCQRWYNDRPVEIQQVLDIRGTDIGNVDSQSESSFPIIIFTTPLALVANVVYHTASLLLLVHKPRLSKALTGPRSSASSTWHAQSIAGIALSNDSFEQWDPILIAALLSVSKQMTHESQQSTLIARLSHIKSTTGINLDREIENLHSEWNMSRYEDEIY